MAARIENGRNRGLEPKDLENPLVLSFDLFTPLQRTPWAGTYISHHIKNDLLPEKVGIEVGESWEFSCDPDFPTQLLDFSCSLQEAIDSFPELIMSPVASSATSGICEILVKILNADKPLSVQVHPSDDELTLQSHECGKPESWLVLHAEPKAGLYLGFSKQLTKQKLKNHFSSGQTDASILQFVPVKAGDYFDLLPGVPHAVGAGVCILEPQRILPGKRGKTLRLWDWGRKYDQSGREDPHAGKARELHLDQALTLLHPEKQWGVSFVEDLKRQAEIINSVNYILKSYPANSFYRVYQLNVQGKKSLSIDVQDGFLVGMCLNNSFWMQGKSGLNKEYIRGQPLLFPSCCFPLQLETQEEVKMVFVGPPSSQLLIS